MKKNMTIYEKRQVECAKKLRMLILRRQKSLLKEIDKLFLYAPELIDDDNAVGDVIDYVNTALTDSVMSLENIIDEIRQTCPSWGPRKSR